MNQQLEALQEQVQEAKRTRMDANRPILKVEPPNRPILKVEPPLASGQLDLALDLDLALYQVRNIGNGAALNCRFSVHEYGTGKSLICGLIEPIGVDEFSTEIPITTRGLLHPALTITYTDIFGNQFWTLYDIVSQSQTIGEGKPPHLR